MQPLILHNYSSDREKILRLFNFTKHAKKRMRQRSICRNDIRQAFHYGRELYYDGLHFFALDCNNIPEGKDHVLIDELEGIVVLLDLDAFKVVTVYRNPNAIPKIEQRIKNWCKRKGRKMGVKGVPPRIQ